ncbi:radical SAM protein [Streptomyces sp. NBC_01481]|uniref:radical SAM protein n=1 Tax=Streptomyces sp. NBC_01481 TaxID=2975869 RepID=UPI00224EAE38|nr:radical SAM protein [Streptomyces sp. NBC_01481]MCX4587457.1 radical SAM protein [Streptomyces sp. NBC_01481]
MRSASEEESGATLGMRPSLMVMQPTTLCNLDCRYCYLPDREKRLDMPAAVNRAAAEAAARWSDSGHRVEVLWHAGEPLTLGVRKFEELLSVWLPGTVHRFQTNATLIDDAWCDLFDRYRVQISVSVDGPEAMNLGRVTRAGAPAGRRIAAGIAVLVRRRIPFDVLSVLRDPSPEAARSIYAHACDLGAEQLGILPEEAKGSHRAPSRATRSEWVAFFAELFAQWRANPVVRLRELESVANCYDAVRSGITAAGILDIPVEPIPTISYDGEVAVMSPDLAGFGHPRHGLFTIGNVLKHPLEDLLTRAGAVEWVREALAGVDACRRKCRYAAVCGGSWPANKYFELGRLDGTETSYCRNLHQAKIEGALLCRP